MTNKTRNPVHDNWITPKEFFDKLNAIYNFDDFDPCPPYCNLAEFDGLRVSWAKRTYCNPPYSQKLKEAFLYKAYHESLMGKLAVCLVPVSTSTVIFHDLIYLTAKIEFIRGRLPFEGIDNDGNWCNPETGMYELDPDETMYRRRVKRNGQQDLMLVIFGSDQLQ